MFPIPEATYSKLLHNHLLSLISPASTCPSLLPSITSGWLNLFRIHTMMMMMMMMQLSSLTLRHGTPIPITSDLDNMDLYIWYVETRTRNSTGGCPDMTNDDELRFLFKASKLPIRELD